MIFQTHNGWRLNFTVGHAERYLPFIKVQDVSLAKEYKYDRPSQIADVQRFVITIEYEHLSVHLHKRTFSFKI